MLRFMRSDIDREEVGGGMDFDFRVTKKYLKIMYRQMSWLFVIRIVDRRFHRKDHREPSVVWPTRCHIFIR